MVSSDSQHTWCISCTHCVKSSRSCSQIKISVLIIPVHLWSLTAATQNYHPSKTFPCAEIRLCEVKEKLDLAREQLSRFGVSVCVQKVLGLKPMTDRVAKQGLAPAFHGVCMLINPKLSQRIPLYLVQKTKYISLYIFFSYIQNNRL